MTGLARRGVVEGFYGTPWTHAQRLGFLEFAGDAGLHEYCLAPKDDPYHRERWREPYPADDIARISELAEAAAANGVRYLAAISPGLSMRFTDALDHQLLAEKGAQLLDAGAADVLLLFDDVPLSLTDAADRAVHGEGPHGAGRAHGEAARRFADAVLRPRGPGTVTVCPTEYAGCAGSPYRDGLASTLPDDALVLWTGADIVVGEITRADIDAAGDAFGRRLLLWDNFPVNDFDRSRLFLGPLLGRTADVAGSALVGVLANPMVEAAPSRFALSSVADWSRDPAGYDPASSAARALRRVAGDAADALGPLVAACSSWPPSSPQDPAMLEDAEAALSGDGAALDRLEAAGRALIATGAVPVPDPPDPDLLPALGPWIAAAVDAGSVLTTACTMLRAGSRDEHARAALKESLTRAEEHEANVLRGVVPPFARAVLEAAGGAP